jgi:hypothetical protein
MDDTGSQEQHAPRRRTGSRDEGSPGERESKKPGSKGHGHKRTKTGCLSEPIPSQILSFGQGHCD